MVGVGAGVGNFFFPTLTPARSRRLPPVNRDDFDRTVVHPSEVIENQEGKESDGVQTKLKRHLLMGFSLTKISDITLGPSRSLCDCVNRFKDCYTGHIQRNQR